MNNEPDRIVEREQVLILLVDRNTGSAAESFANRVLNMSNTLIIGSHTGGAFNFDLQFGNLRMPRSGLNFALGASMHLHPYGHLIEGVGIAPDIWVDGDALTAAVAMLQRNR